MREEEREEKMATPEQPAAGLHLHLLSRGKALNSNKLQHKEHYLRNRQQKRQRRADKISPTSTETTSGRCCCNRSTKPRLQLLQMVMVAFFSTLISGLAVLASPPIDYFIETSQLVQINSSGGESQSPSKVSGSLLPSIESIYALPSSAGEAPHGALLASRVRALIQNGSHTHDNDRVDLETTQYAWMLMEQQAINYMRHRVDKVRPLLGELSRESQVSESCRVALDGWLDSLAELRHWATLMWNSWGNLPPAGIFQGSFTDLGSYRGCMAVEDDTLPKSIGEAQYCLLDFQPVVPTRPRFHSIFKLILDHADGKLNGGDFHQLIGDRDARTIYSQISAHGYPSQRYKQLQTTHPDATGGGLRVPEAQSQVVASKYMRRTIVNQQNTSTTNSSSEADSAASQATLNLTLHAEALVELARKAQYFYYVKFRMGACLPSKCSPQDVEKLASTEDLRSTGSLVNWLLPFSIWTNAKRLFALESAGTHNDLECIHGLRFFSMLWVIYGHSILYMEYQSFTHFYDVVEKQIPSFILLPSLNANFSVDTFFVISGILTTYVTWEYTKGDPRKFNKFAFTISRYIRLTPQLAIVILCFFLLPLFGDGPLYKQVAEAQAQLCYKNWAINLLYLQSYVNSDKLCIDPSWWLSIEMSFHVISMLVIVVMIQNVRWGMIVNALIAAILTLWGAQIHYSNRMAIQYLPSIPQRYEVNTEQTKLFFHRPYPHAAAYFIGIALGYVLANKTIKKLTQIQVLQGWCVCAMGIFVSLWGSYYWNLGAPYTQLQATIYYNLCQILWPISIAWIILACSLGHGGLVNSILAARCFVPLGRITYMTYLSHALVIYFHSASTSIPLEPSMLLFTYLFVANTALALALGILLTVVYESPILNLQKQLFSYLTRKFDPTMRDGQYLPASSEQSHTNRYANEHTLANKLNKSTSNGSKGLQEYPLKNGLSGGASSMTVSNCHPSGVANCLLLDGQRNKQNQPTDHQTQIVLL